MAREKLKNGECDCGNSATLRDGSGRFCAECDRAVKEIRERNDRFIARQRFALSEYQDAFRCAVRS